MGSFQKSPILHQWKRSLTRWLFCAYTLHTGIVRRLNMHRVQLLLQWGLLCTEKDKLRDTVLYAVWWTKKRREIYSSWHGLTWVTLKLKIPAIQSYTVRHLHTINEDDSDKHMCEHYHFQHCSLFCKLPVINWTVGQVRGSSRLFCTVAQWLIWADFRQILFQQILWIKIILNELIP